MSGPKRAFYRIENKKIIAGVCGGIAEHFGLDANIMRLGFVILTLAWTAGLWIYLVAAIILPKKSEIYPDEP